MRLVLSPLVVCLLSATALAQPCTNNQFAPCLPFQSAPSPRSVSPIEQSQTGEYGRVTLHNESSGTVILNIKRLFPPTIIASCTAPPNSDCTTGPVPAGLVDLEAASGPSKLSKTYSLVNGENYEWTISNGPQ